MYAYIVITPDLALPPWQCVTLLLQVTYYMERTQYVHYVYATEHNPPSRLHSHTLFADSRFQTLQRRETLTPDCKLSFKTKCQGAHIDVLVTHIIQLYNKQTIHKQTH